MRRRLLLPVVVVLMAALAVACGGSDSKVDANASTTIAEGGDDSTTSPETEPSGPTSEPGASIPEFGGDTDTVSGEAVGDTIALLTEVRVARNEGFDRVVFEFEADSLPAYEVGYADPPFFSDGEGAEVTVAGEQFLSVRLQGSSGFNLDTGEQTFDGGDRVEGSGTETVTEVVRTGDFEALMSWIVGLNSKEPFKVTTLSAPSRIVIDVAHGE